MARRRMLLAVVLVVVAAFALLRVRTGTRRASTATPADSASDVDPPCFASHIGLPCSS